jgi:hypothetical protein
MGSGICDACPASRPSPAAGSDRGDTPDRYPGKGDIVYRHLMRHEPCVLGDDEGLRCVPAELDGHAGAARAADGGDEEIARFLRPGDGDAADLDLADDVGRCGRAARRVAVEVAGLVPCCAGGERYQTQDHAHYETCPSGHPCCSDDTVLLTLLRG